MPVPANPALGGAQLFFQWVVVDPAGPLLGVATLSDGLHALLGS